MPIKAVLFDLDGTLLPMDYDAFMNIRAQSSLANAVQNGKIHINSSIDECLIYLKAITLADYKTVK